jgi:hypothetical protein
MQIAATMFREHTRSLIEKNIVEALNILKSRSKVVYEFLWWFLAYYILRLDLVEVPLVWFVLHVQNRDAASDWRTGEGFGI